MIKKFYQALIHYFANKYIPVKYDRLNYLELKSILTKRRVSTSRMNITDISYFVTNEDTIKNYLSFNIFRHIKYVANIYDCDNYAISVLAIFKNLLPECAFGMAFVTRPKLNDRHALNFFINENKEVIWVEPQTNKIYKDNSYKIDLVIV